MIWKKSICFYPTFFPSTAARHVLAHGFASNQERNKGGSMNASGHRGGAPQPSFYSYFSKVESKKKFVTFGFFLQSLKSRLHSVNVKKEENLERFYPYSCEHSYKDKTFCSTRLYAKAQPSHMAGYLNNNKELKMFFNQCFDKGRLKNFVLWFLLNYGENKTVRLVEQLKNVGFYYASKAGISLGIEDLKIPPKKFNLILDAEKETSLTIHQFKRGEITGVERFQRLIDIWHHTSEFLKQEVINYFEATDILNPVYMMAFSGARGNISQVRQLVGMRGLMSDPQGQILDFPIRSNFREGLTLTEYIISSYGARKGIVDTALRTANAGYLTRRLVDVAQHVIITNFDCQTKRGIYLTNMKEGNKTIYSLSQKLVGRILARDLFTLGNEKIASRNEEITSILASEISKKFEKVFVRSPLTCEKLTCQLCYGWSLAQGKLVSIGEAVGVVAAQSIGEPGTQLTMRTFHTGGVFAGDVSDQIKAPFNGVLEYVTAIAGTLIRTPQGKIAFLTKTEGSLIVHKTKQKISGSHQVPEEGQEKSSFDTMDTIKQKMEKQESRKYKIPPYTLLYLRNGQNVVEKEVIAQISSISQKSNATDSAEFTIKSEIEGQFYTKSLVLREKFVGPILKKKQKEDKFHSFFQNIEFDKFYEAWTWGYAWILSGKVYEFKNCSYSLPIIGDFLNTKSYMSQINWSINLYKGENFDYEYNKRTPFGNQLDVCLANQNKPQTKLLNASESNKHFRTPLGNVVGYNSSRSSELFAETHTSNKRNEKNRQTKPFQIKNILFLDIKNIFYKKYGYALELSKKTQFFESSSFKSSFEYLMRNADSMVGGSKAASGPRGSKDLRGITQDKAGGYNISNFISNSINFKATIFEKNFSFNKKQKNGIRLATQRRPDYLFFNKRAMSLISRQVLERRQNLLTIENKFNKSHNSFKDFPYFLQWFPDKYKTSTEGSFIIEIPSFFHLSFTNAKNVSGTRLATQHKPAFAPQLYLEAKDPSGFSLETCNRSSSESDLTGLYTYKKRKFLNKKIERLSLLKNREFLFKNSKFLWIPYFVFKISNFLTTKNKINNFRASKEPLFNQDENIHLNTNEVGKKLRSLNVLPTFVEESRPHFSDQSEIKQKNLYDQGLDGRPFDGQGWPSNPGPSTEWPTSFFGAQLLSESKTKLSTGKDSTLKRSKATIINRKQFLSFYSNKIGSLQVNRQSNFHIFESSCYNLNKDVQVVKSTLSLFKQKECSSFLKLKKITNYTKQSIVSQHKKDKNNKDLNLAIKKFSVFSNQKKLVKLKKWIFDQSSDGHTVSLTAKGTSKKHLLKALFLQNNRGFDGHLGPSTGRASSPGLSNNSQFMSLKSYCKLVESPFKKFFTGFNFDLLLLSIDSVKDSVKKTNTTFDLYPNYMRGSVYAVLQDDYQTKAKKSQVRGLTTTPLMAEGSLAAPPVSLRIADSLRESTGKGKSTIRSSSSLTRMKIHLANAKQKPILALEQAKLLSENSKQKNRSSFLLQYFSANLKSIKMSKNLEQNSLQLNSFKNKKSFFNFLSLIFKHPSIFEIQNNLYNKNLYKNRAKINTCLFTVSIPTFSVLQNEIGSIVQNPTLKLLVPTYFEDPSMSSRQVLVQRPKQRLRGESNAEDEGQNGFSNKGVRWPPLAIEGSAIEGVNVDSNNSKEVNFLTDNLDNMVFGQGSGEDKKTKVSFVNKEDDKNVSYPSSLNLPLNKKSFYHVIAKKGWIVIPTRFNLYKDSLYKESKGNGAANYPHQSHLMSIKPFKSSLSLTQTKTRGGFDGHPFDGAAKQKGLDGHPGPSAGRPTNPGPSKGKKGTGKAKTKTASLVNYLNYHKQLNLAGQIIFDNISFNTSIFIESLVLNEIFKIEKISSLSFLVKNLNLVYAESLDECQLYSNTKATSYSNSQPFKGTHDSIGSITEADNAKNIFWIKNKKSRYFMDFSSIYHQEISNEENTFINSAGLHTSSSPFPSQWSEAVYESPLRDEKESVAERTHTNTKAGEADFIRKMRNQKGNNNSFSTYVNKNYIEVESLRLPFNSIEDLMVAPSWAREGYRVPDTNYINDHKKQVNEVNAENFNVPCIGFLCQPIQEFEQMNNIDIKKYISLFNQNTINLEPVPIYQDSFNSSFFPKGSRTAFDHQGNVDNFLLTKKADLEVDTHDEKQNSSIGISSSPPMLWPSSSSLRLREAGSRTRRGPQAKTKAEEVAIEPEAETRAKSKNAGFMSKAKTILKNEIKLFKKTRKFKNLSSVRLDNLRTKPSSSASFVFSRKEKTNEANLTQMRIRNQLKPVSIYYSFVKNKSNKKIKAFLKNKKKFIKDLMFSNKNKFSFTALQRSSFLKTKIIVNKSFNFLFNLQLSNFSLRKINTSPLFGLYLRKNYTQANFPHNLVTLSFLFLKAKFLAFANTKTKLEFVKNILPKSYGISNLLGSQLLSKFPRASFFPSMTKGSMVTPSDPRLRFGFDGHPGSSTGRRPKQHRRGLRDQGSLSPQVSFPKGKGAGTSNYKIISDLLINKVINKYRNSNSFKNSLQLSSASRTQLMLVHSRKSLNFSSFLLSYINNSNFPLSLNNEKKFKFSYNPISQFDSSFYPFLSTELIRIFNFYLKKSTYSSPATLIEFYNKSDAFELPLVSIDASQAKANQIFGQIPKQVRSESKNEAKNFNIYAGFNNLINNIFECPCFSFNITNSLDLFYLKNTASQNTQFFYLNDLNQSYSLFIHYLNKSKVNQQKIAQTSFYSPFKGELVYVQTASVLPSYLDKEKKFYSNIDIRGSMTAGGGHREAITESLPVLPINTSCMILTKKDLVSYSFSASKIKSSKYQKRSLFRSSSKDLMKTAGSVATSGHQGGGELRLPVSFSPLRGMNAKDENSELTATKTRKVSSFRISLPNYDYLINDTLIKFLNMSSMASMASEGQGSTAIEHLSLISKEKNGFLRNFTLQEKVQDMEQEFKTSNAILTFSKTKVGVPLQRNSPFRKVNFIKSKKSFKNYDFIGIRLATQRGPEIKTKEPNTKQQSSISLLGDFYMCGDPILYSSENISNSLISRDSQIECENLNDQPSYKKEPFYYSNEMVSVHSSGQLIHYNNNKITLRYAQPIFISSKGRLHKFDGDFIEPKTPVITLSYQKLKTGDIIQGIPKVEQFFEARTTKRGRLFRDSLPSLLKALFKRYQSKLPLELAVRQSFYKIQQIIVDGVQRVYKSQGVTISEKHLEVIVKQMTSKVRILDGAQTGFFPGEVVDLSFVEKINLFLIKKITYEPLVLGITKSSLEVDSFLSASSFQQTTRVLSQAAIYRKKDFLKGLKENVILGNLIPAGTGYLVYLDNF